MRFHSLSLLTAKPWAVFPWSPKAPVPRDTWPVYTPPQAPNLLFLVVMVFTKSQKNRGWKGSLGFSRLDRVAWGPVQSSFEYLQNISQSLQAPVPVFYYLHDEKEIKLLSNCNSTGCNLCCFPHPSHAQVWEESGSGSSSPWLYGLSLVMCEGQSRHRSAHQPCWGEMSFDRHDGTRLWEEVPHGRVLDVCMLWDGLFWRLLWKELIIHGQHQDFSRATKLP